MPELFSLVIVFLAKYLVPFLYAIGLIFFVYGCIEYFIVGIKGGDSGRAQHGRELLLSSIKYFVIALFVYAIVALVGWLTQVMQALPEQSVPTLQNDARVEVRQNGGVLPVPNVPKSND